MEGHIFEQNQPGQSENLKYAKRGMLKAGEVHFQDVRKDKRSVSNDKTRQRSLEEQVTSDFLGERNSGDEDKNKRQAFQAMIRESNLSWEKIENILPEKRRKILELTDKYLQEWRSVDGDNQRRAENIRKSLMDIVSEGIN